MMAVYGELANNVRMTGDTDLDGRVSFRDFLTLAAQFGDSGGWADGDFDGDGFVGFEDFLLLVSHFGMATAAIRGN